jgi:hypothetical protein
LSGDPSQAKLTLAVPWPKIGRIERKSSSRIISPKRTTRYALSQGRDRNSSPVKRASKPAFDSLNSVFEFVALDQLAFLAQMVGARRGDGVCSSSPASFCRDGREWEFWKR